MPKSSNGTLKPSAQKIVPVDTEAKASRQGCSPRDRGLGLESTRDQFYAVLVLVLKGRSRNVLRPAVYGTCALYGAVISRIGVFITKCHRREHPLQ